MSLWEAYLTMYRQWRIAFEIGALNRNLGAAPTPLGDLLRRRRWLYTRRMSTAPDEGLDEFRLDRTQFSVGHLTDPDDAVAYWLTQPVEERLRALELLRRTFYGYTSASEGLQRVFEVAQLKPR